MYSRVFIFVMMNIDAVITYVDMNDPVWMNSYSGIYSTISPMRFKSLGTIHLQIDCIRKFMSWINNIYVVVSNREQISTDKAIVVTHDQIIPRELLPTFNSTTIEMYLHRIPNLSEYFIYFNDDTIPINYVEQSAFYDNDKPQISFKFFSNPPCNKFRMRCKNSSDLAREIANLEPSSEYIHQDHICTIHKKSSHEYVWKVAKDKILSSLTRKRCEHNYNQYLFSDYLYYSKQCGNKKLNYIFINYNNISSDHLYDLVISQKYDFICVCDDVECTDNYNSKLIQALNKILSK